MEAQAALDGVKMVFNDSEGKIRVNLVCGDDDGSFRKALKPISEGGLLDEKYGKVEVRISDNVTS